MHTLKLTVEDDIYHNIMFLLSNLNLKGLKVEEDIKIEDWSHLELEIDKGLSSGVSDTSHDEIMKSIKKKYE